MNDCQPNDGFTLILVYATKLGPFAVWGYPDEPKGRCAYG